MQQGGSYLKEEVGEEDIAALVSKWTAVPVSKMLEGEMQKLLSMEANLEKRVVGKAPRWSRWRTPFGAHAPAWVTRSARLAHSCFWGRQVSARLRPPARWRSSCSMTRSNDSPSI
jgi:hypothetical protein